MESQNTSESLLNKANQYKAKLEALEAEKAQIEKQLIILEEQLNPYKEQIQNAFGTLDPDELGKIVAQYEESIAALEKELE